MEHPKTVRVVSPVTAENPLGYIVINATDVTDEHELYGQADPADEAPRRRGRPPKALSQE
ncbi:hypothetical protein ABNQ39_20600 [Azospirillum sp. A26]|uniref:hypothetical protein n=1 Tax=Azospirillum sp. A26 TaxID=3160607 RepID=UPI00366C46E7